MASSCKLGPLNPPMGICKIPSRTLGPLGFFDQGDPNVTTLLGDTPGSLGAFDWAKPDHADLFSDNRIGLPDGQCRAGDGTPLALATGQVDSSGLKPVATGGTSLNWDDVKADFERWEGKFAHMYLDTKGLVTVGVGKMLPDAVAAKALGFVRRADGVAATAAEIETDFKEVSKQTKGKLAKLYKQYTQLDLPDAEIDSLLKTVVDGFEKDLEANFDDYKNYPVNVKRALLDMIYNLGLQGLLKFKKLKSAIEARDWEKASKECHRNGPSDERNNWTRDLFLSEKK